MSRNGLAYRQLHVSLSIATLGALGPGLACRILLGLVPWEVVLLTSQQKALSVLVPVS